MPINELYILIIKQIKSPNANHERANHVKHANYNNKTINIKHEGLYNVNNINNKNKNHKSYQSPF